MSFSSGQLLDQRYDIVRLIGRTTTRTMGTPKPPRSRVIPTVPVGLATSIVQATIGSGWPTSGMVLARISLDALAPTQPQYLLDQWASTGSLSFPSP